MSDNVEKQGYLGVSIGELLGRRRRERQLTLQRLADMVGCAKSYLWQIEHDRRSHPPSTELLERLERALLMEAGALTRAAAWQATPAAVRERVAELESTRRAADQLTALLRSRGIDEAYRSGELKKLVQDMGPESDARPIAPAGRVLPREVPLINKVAAGYPREFTDLGYPARAADEYVRTPDIDDPDAFAARVVGDSMQPEYREGDIVVFSPARELSSGMDCFARIEPDHETTFKRVYFEKGADGRELIRLQPLNPAYPPRVLGREDVAGLYAAVSVTRRV